MMGGDNVKYILHSTKCAKCGCEIKDGSTCYDYEDETYCENCFDEKLEELKESCEREAMDMEEWI